MRRLCNDLERRGLPIGSSVLANSDDVWRALRKFFSDQSEEATTEGGR
jgi:uncharacterized sporulation protein YeaH/YhbH (DUF444 family)